MDNNPEKLRAGDACYGVYMPAFDATAPERSLPGCTQVIPGTLQASYLSNPSGGTSEPANFLPDDLLPGTRYDGACYDLPKWFVCRTRAAAMAARASFAKIAIDGHKAQIAFLEQFL